VQALEAALAAAFGFPTNGAGTYGQNCRACAVGDNIGALVRLAFHDAAGGGGGMNGCIDFSAPDNNGLQTIISELEAVWLPFSAMITFADAIVVAAQLAIRTASTPSGNNNGLPNTQTLNLALRVGRTDVATCNGLDTEIPPASLTFPQMNTFFNSRFGLTPTEIVAALGAHSVGRAEAQNTGFEGGWISFQSSFTNNYFSTLIGIPWRISQANLFRAGNQNIMLTVDTELAIAPSSGCTFFNAQTFNGGDRACPLNNMGLAAVQQFADFNTGTAAWYNTFRSSWMKITEAGQSNLVAPV
jgi:catalase (peroxidase I)